LPVSGIPRQAAKRMMQSNEGNSVGDEANRRKNKRMLPEDGQEATVYGDEVAEPACLTAVEGRRQRRQVSDREIPKQEKCVGAQKRPGQAHHAAQDHCVLQNEVDRTQGKRLADSPGSMTKPVAVIALNNWMEAHDAIDPVGDKGKPQGQLGG